MIKYTNLTLLLLVCTLLIGCNESHDDLYDIYDTQYDSRYDSAEVRKAKDKAIINDINNQSELKTAEHKIFLLAAENNIKLVKDTNIRSANYNAVDFLLKKLPTKLRKDSPVLVASLVNLDNLNESSTFGRVVSEQIASRLKQKDYSTIEMKLRTNVFIKEGSGEFLLSREISKISIKHRAQAVVVGTYAVASDRVYITVRIVNVNDGNILASCDYEIPMSRDVFKMLLKGKTDQDWL